MEFDDLFLTAEHSQCSQQTLESCISSFPFEDYTSKKSDFSSKLTAGTVGILRVRFREGFKEHEQN